MEVIRDWFRREGRSELNEHSGGTVSVAADVDRGIGRELIFIVEWVDDDGAHRHSVARPRVAIESLVESMQRWLDDPESFLARRFPS